MNNRDMFYQNYNQGYSNPGAIIPPSGYNYNQEYQSYGNPSFIGSPNVINTQNDYEERISKLERQVRNLDTRLQKLESVSSKDDNFYMI